MQTAPQLRPFQLHSFLMHSSTRKLIGKSTKKHLDHQVPWQLPLSSETAQRLDVVLTAHFA